ncbi:hypothetical protein GQ457_14G009630 [Hibiscus cannabinus]
MELVPNVVDNCSIDLHGAEAKCLADNIVGMIFESHFDAWEFYKDYAKISGFSARRATTRKDAVGNVKAQEFCCSRAGFRKSKISDVDRQRAPRAITRIGCKAKVVVMSTNSNQWRISFSHTEHNHPLCPTNMRPFLRSNRKVTCADIAEARAMKTAGIRTSQIMNLFQQQSGGFHNVGFIKKDLYNAIQTYVDAELCDGDVNALIAYFDCKKEQDNGFFIQYSLDESLRLHNLFWCDSTSRSDYTCFGDIIAFDTTYKANAYGRPLMPIVGVNHHHQTIVFGIAILADETADTFEWVLRAFLEAMFNKTPISVVTDGDRAMQRAIKTVFPLARHRICSWHLSRNAQANIGDKKFTAAFSRCMSAWWTTTEFDREWRSVVKHFNIEDHPWVVEKDQTQHLWAQAYLTGHFFGNVRSTQRCESMNAVLAIVLNSKKTYIDFVRAIENAIADMRIKELKEDFVSAQTTPYPTTKLTDLEGSASELYTRASFGIFQTELQNETLYRLMEPIVEIGQSRTFHLTKYRDPSKIYEVVLNVITENLMCSCRKFETVGIPCCHQLHVLKLQDYSNLPQSLILHRWTKNAKLSAPSFIDFNVSPELKQMSRFASLRSMSSRLCYVASQTDETFRSAKDEIVRLTAEFDETCTFMASSSHTENKRNVQDPRRKPVKRKQNHKNQVPSSSRKYHCSFCNMEGHNKNTCPRLKLQLPTNSYGQTSTFFEEDDMEIPVPLNLFGP